MEDWSELCALITQSWWSARAAAASVALTRAPHTTESRSVAEQRSGERRCDPRERRSGEPDLTPFLAPVGVAEPAVAESMCSQPVAHAGDIVVREYGLPANMTLATARIDAPEFHFVLGGGGECVRLRAGDCTPRPETRNAEFPHRCFVCVHVPPWGSLQFSLSPLLSSPLYILPHVPCASPFTRRTSAAPGTRTCPRR